MSNASGTTCKSKASSTHSLRLSRSAKSAKKARQKQKQDELILKAQQAKVLLEIEAEIQAADARETVLREAEKESTQANNDLGAIRILNPTTEDTPEHTGIYHLPQNNQLNEAAKNTTEQTAIYHLPPLPHLPQDNQLNLAATLCFQNSNSDLETLRISDTLVTYNMKSLIPKATLQPFNDYTNYRAFVS